ncbi:hypothetical protein GB993_08635, partial [Lactobacillus rossiae]|nr:hypothetical protein [Furfurilactobacillus milii]
MIEDFTKSTENVEASKKITENKSNFNKTLLLFSVMLGFLGVGNTSAHADVDVSGTTSSSDIVGKNSASNDTENSAVTLKTSANVSSNVKNTNDEVRNFSQSTSVNTKNSSSVDVSQASSVSSFAANTSESFSASTKSDINDKTSSNISSVSNFDDKKQSNNSAESGPQAKRNSDIFKNSQYQGVETSQSSASLSETTVSAESLASKANDSASVGTLKADNGSSNVAQISRAQNLSFDVVQPVNQWVTNTNGSRSYYDKNGEKYVKGIYTINGARYHFNDDGMLTNGLSWDSKTGSWLYSDQANGELVTNDFRQANGYWYYFTNNGSIANGLTWIPQRHTWNFYDSSDHQLVTNDFRQANGYWYYFTNNGSIA